MRNQSVNRDWCTGGSFSLGTGRTVLRCPIVNEGSFQLTSAKECREFGNECLDWAKTAKSEREREIFLEMARTWLYAAANLEGRLVGPALRDSPTPNSSAGNTEARTVQDLHCRSAEADVQGKPQNRVEPADKQSEVRRMSTKIWKQTKERSRRTKTERLEDCQSYQRMANAELRRAAKHERGRPARRRSEALDRPPES